MNLCEGKGNGETGNNAKGFHLVKTAIWWIYSYHDKDWEKRTP